MIVISDLLSIALRIYAYLIIIRAFSTWFPQLRNHEIVQTLYKITDPVMKPASKYIQNGLIRAADRRRPLPLP